MSARFMFDLVDPMLLTQYVRDFSDEVLRNEIGFFEQWLPNTLNDELEWRATKGGRVDVDIAEYRAFDTVPTMTGRQGFERIRGELAPVSRQIPLTEEEHLRLRNLQAGDTGQARLIAQVYDDAELMTRAVEARIELARAQLIYTGTFAIAENGFVMTADFGMSSTHKPTVATAWSNPASTILSDLLAWTQLYVDDNGEMPESIVMSRQALGYMYNNTEMKAAAGFAGTTPGKLNNEMIDAILGANDLPPVTLYDAKVRIDGVQTRLVPADKVLLMPSTSSPLGATHYGVTAEALKLAAKGMIVASKAAGIVAVNLENDSPVQTSTLATAIAVPIMPNPDLVIAADIAP